MFSVIIPGRPCLTDMITVSPNQSAFNFPSTPHFSHVVVFILPGNVLPPDVAAAVYMQLPGDQQFRFLGAIANEKPSAIFKVNLPSSGMQNGMTGGGGGEGVISLGISIEPIANIQVQLAQLKEHQQQGGESNSMMMVVANNRKSPNSPPTTKLLAQRIIKNAFNFLASFADGQGGQVPLKSFEEWWKKFERKVENDPGFLERDED